MCGVIEPARRNRRFLDQSALHLVRNRQSREELLARRVCVFGSGEHRTDIVGRMAGFPFCEKIVHEVEIANESRIEEGRSVGRGHAAAKKRRAASRSELIDVPAQRRDRPLSERPDRTAD